MTPRGHGVRECALCTAAGREGLPNPTRQGLGTHLVVRNPHWIGKGDVQTSIGSLWDRKTQPLPTARRLNSSQRALGPLILTIIAASCPLSTFSRKSRVPGRSCAQAGKSDLNIRPRRWKGPELGEGEAGPSASRRGERASVSTVHLPAVRPPQAATPEFACPPRIAGSEWGTSLQPPPDELGSLGQAGEHFP
jgi:hypothetical protein